MRKCIACGESRAKRDLYRFVKDKEDRFTFDPTGRLNGRGAYVCPDPSCINRVFKERKLEKEFKTKISIETYKELLEETNMHIEKLGGGAIEYGKD